MYLDTPLLLALAAVLGLVFGSFLNVCICRIPKKESIVTGSSHCTSCGAPILARDLIPVISYLVLRGRCRACKARISIRYPLVELANALAWVAVCARYGFSFDSLIYCALVSMLLIVAMIDIDTMIVPPQMTISILILGVIGLFLIKSPTLIERGIGFLVGGLPFLLVALASKGGMGGGDIKLMAVCGLLLGWKLILLSQLVAVVAGGIYAAILLLTKRKKKGAELALVPFLAGGMFVCILFGNQMLQWYLSKFF